MIFAPTIKITEVATDSSSFTVEDTTPAVSVSAPYGYGAPNAPVDFAGVNFVQVMLQYLTETPAVQMLNVTGTLDTGITATFTLRDGVQYIQALYGIADTQGVWSIEDTEGLIIKLTLNPGETRTLADILDGITYLALVDYPDVLHRVASIDTTTGVVTLHDAITDVSVIVTQLVRYYSAIAQILVINSGNAAIVKEIANMPLTNCGCDPETSRDLMDRILLKLSAQIAFSKSSFIKAHNAAVLLDKSGQPAQTCSTC